MLREQEILLQTVSLISWAQALREGRMFCPQITSLVEFVPCCTELVANMCKGPGAQNVSRICTNLDTARRKAMEYCRELLRQIIGKYYEIDLEELEEVEEVEEYGE
jgi:hypothetical protein